jgi:hypothetical protein
MGQNSKREEGEAGYHGHLLLADNVEFNESNQKQEERYQDQ